MTPPRAPETPAPDAAERITARFQELGDWRGETLARVRALIHAALPEVQETFKWAKATSPGVPVWEYGGGLCTGEVYKQAVKLTFHRGASLPDPAGLFNASLEGGTRRAIDIREGEMVDEGAFKTLICAAADANTAIQAARKK